MPTSNTTLHKKMSKPQNTYARIQMHLHMFRADLRGQAYETTLRSHYPALQLVFWHEDLDH